MKRQMTIPNLPSSVIHLQFPLLMAVVLMCCSSCIRLNLNELNKLEPSSTIVKNEYKMRPFSRVDVNVAARVKFVQSTDGDYRVLMKCPDNYVSLFRFRVEGDELVLGFAKNLRKFIDPDDVAIVVRTPRLLEIDSEGLGNIAADSLSTPSLNIDSEGVGNIHIGRLSADRVKVESSGVGNVVLKGVAKTAVFESDGVGNISAAELKAQDVRAEVNGVGSIECFASESIQGSINGVGSLKYGGKPRQKQLHRNGVGTVKEM